MLQRTNPLVTMVFFLRPVVLGRDWGKSWRCALPATARG